MTTTGSSPVVVQAEEAQVGQGAEAGSTQVGQDVVAAGGGDVVGAAGPGGRYPHQAVPLIGQGNHVQAVAAMLVEDLVTMRVPKAY
ncbi:hypothetical protein AB0N14_39190 [Streptomyces sp. NPDC051104]|uniref:hypothetical protein n=1 Tax=Streptomyces sp. NPDC051104 TaxID=3155044 RepID=UPI003416A415